MRAKAPRPAPNIWTSWPTICIVGTSTDDAGASKFGDDGVEKATVRSACPASVPVETMWRSISTRRFDAVSTHRSAVTVAFLAASRSWSSCAFCALPATIGELRNFVRSTAAVICDALTPFFDSVPASVSVTPASASCVFRVAASGALGAAVAAAAAAPSPRVSSSAFVSSFSQPVRSPDGIVTPPCAPNSWSSVPRTGLFA